MKTVFNRTILVVFALAITLSAAVAQARDTVRIRAAFDHTAQLLSGGRAVRAGGPLGECPLGDVLTLSVKVTQGQTAATGNWPKPHACTGHDQRWSSLRTPSAAGDSVPVKQPAGARSPSSAAVSRSPRSVGAGRSASERAPKQHGSCRNGEQSCKGWPSAVVKRRPPGAVSARSRRRSGT